MNVLITGSQGFLAKNLAYKLKKKILKYMVLVVVTGILVRKKNGDILKI